MARKLPLFTERSLDQMMAKRIELSAEFASKLPLVSCTKGCAACCSHPLYISILEGMLLYQYLARHGYWTPGMRKKLEAHANKTFDLAAPIWLLLDTPCPLLDKGLCIAYEARPFTCRVLYAVGDPYNCTPRRIASARIVTRDDITTRFREDETKILARHGLSLVGLPVSRATLIGEKVASGSDDLEHFLSMALESIKPGQTEKAPPGRCALCERNKPENQGVLFKLDDADKEALRFANPQDITEEVFYCRPCHDVLTDIEKGAKVLSGLVETQLRLKGVAPLMAEHAGERLYKTLIEKANIKKDN